VNNNATHNTQNNKHSASDKHSDEGRCPIPWCVKHEQYDVGHPTGEGFFHLSRPRTYRGQAFHMSQDRLLREGRNGRTTFWLNDEELTPAQAKHLGQLLIDTAAGSGS
jgi:hypothetical protein